MKTNLLNKDLKMSPKSSQSGITLIALIVTIIVLLILASITIASITRRKWINKKCF